jgi:hypothetical protein
MRKCSANTGRFAHFGYVDEEFLRCIFDLMLDDAHSSLWWKCPMAYYWFASSASDLYTFWSPRIEHLIGRSITPHSQRYRIEAAGMPAYPDEGISSMLVDTEDSSSTWYGAPGMPAADYLEKLSGESDGFKWLDAALSNGVRLRIRGEHGYLLRQALKHYVHHTIEELHAALPIRMQHQAARCAVKVLASQRASASSLALAA